MEHKSKKEKNAKRILSAVRIMYCLTGIVISAHGMIRHSTYESLLALSTLLLVPALYWIRKLFKWNGGYDLETFIYIFSWLGWSLGGAAEVYSLIPYYDKFVHCLSGGIVSLMALTFYRMLERKHSRQGENPATACFFVFFASMAVAGLFELCEFTLAPIMDRDLQHVLETGVGDTMWDMIVCLIGTLAFILLMIRSAKGKRDALTGAADAFADENSSTITSSIA